MDGSKWHFQYPGKVHYERAGRRSVQGRVGQSRCPTLRARPSHRPTELPGTRCQRFRAFIRKNGRIIGSENL